MEEQPPTADPDTPASPPAPGVDPHQGAVPAELVTLRGSELPWQPVSSSLITVRFLVLGIVLLPLLVGSIVLTARVSTWFAIASGVLLGLAAWCTWLIPRQVRAMTWIELPDELVIRRGRLYRSLAAIPYGRLQYVDMDSGPLQRAFGLATLTIHTASPSAGGVIKGLSADTAEALRARLAALGESQRAGL